MPEGNDPLSHTVEGFSRTAGSRELIAPWWHTAFFVLLILAAAAFGAAFQSQSESGAEEVRERNALVPLYLSLIGFEWLLFLYVRWGLSLRGLQIRELIGYRWSGWKDVLRDVIIALLLWIVCREMGALVKRATGPSEAKSIVAFLPQGPVEMLLWVGLSISAGICEEVIYRGYLQRQFSLLAKNAAAGLVAQSLLFGISHGYQGLQLVVTITVGGVLYGLFARWRRNLRPVMVAHAWSDIVGIYPWG